MGKKKVRLNPGKTLFDLKGNPIKEKKKTLYQKMLKRNNTNNRMSNADLKRATTMLPKKSPSEMADSITNYYKDLMK